MNCSTSFAVAIRSRALQAFARPTRPLWPGSDAEVASSRLRRRRTFGKPLTLRISWPGPPGDQAPVCRLPSPPGQNAEVAVGRPDRDDGPARGQPRSTAGRSSLPVVSGIFLVATSRSLPYHLCRGPRTRRDDFAPSDSFRPLHRSAQCSSDNSSSITSSIPTSESPSPSSWSSSSSS